MIKYSFITIICITLVSCTYSNKKDSFITEPINYEEKLILFSSNDYRRKIGQMTQVDQQFLDTIQDIADLSIGSPLSGGGSIRTLIISILDKYVRQFPKSSYHIQTRNSSNLWN